MRETYVTLKTKAIEIFAEKRKRILISLAIILLLVIIWVVSACVNGSKTSNIAGNLNNYGYAVENEGWIYYVATEDDEPNGIYKVKKNGSKTRKISDNYGVYFNVEGNYLYYVGGDYEKDETNLIKMKLNGKKEEVLVSDVDSGAVTVSDGWIYYYKDYDLYRIKTNGEHEEKVSNKSINYYQIDGKWIYYIYYKSSTYYIAKMKTNGEESTKLAEIDSSDGSYDALIVKNNKIYYVQSNIYDDYNYKYQIYSMKENGKSVKKQCELPENIKYINLQEDEIYYTVTEDYDEYEIHSINYNGKNDKLITATQESGAINVVGKWVFYINENQDKDTKTFRIKTNGKSMQEL